MAMTRRTALGTPCSGKWSEAWVAEVDRVEGQLKSRICGCHTMSGRPCTLGPASSTFSLGKEKVEPKETDSALRAADNGRCRFHGGVVGIGAPKGNRNALIHGLYSRRIQRCGMQCVLWQHCPMAGKDVLALEPPDRPECVYERAEYDDLMARFCPTDASTADGSAEGAIYTSLGRSPRSQTPHSESPEGVTYRDSEERVPPAREEGLRAMLREEEERANPKPSLDDAPAVPILYHNVATYQMMLTRAQAALAVAQLTDDTRAEGEHYRMHTSKVGALLQAQLRIARELRQWVRLLANDAVQAVLGAAPPGDTKDEPPKPISLPKLMQPIIEEAEGVIEAALRPGRSKRRPPLDAPDDDGPFHDGHLSPA